MMSERLGNPLERDGTSQRQRALPALAPEFAKVDERGTREVLLYLTRFAELLRYYDETNAAVGDWRPFLDADASVLVAAIGASGEAERAAAVFRGAARRVDVEAATFVTTYAELFPPLFSAAAAFDAWLRSAKRTPFLETKLEDWIRASLKVALRDAVGAARRAREVQIAVAVPDLSAYAKSPWELADAADSSLFPSGAPVTNPREREHALKVVERAFDRFHEALKQVESSAPLLFQQTLESFPSHEPHAGLLIAVLELLGRARDALNGFTKSHLDFYLREVLALTPRAALPDRAHVLVELTKRHEPLLLPAGTLLSAGKDRTGVDRVYATEKAFVVNHAQVDAKEGLKTVFVRREGGLAVGVHAAKVANSADGLGAPLEGEEQRWPLFGSAEMPEARLGFAVSSPLLWLSGGTRTIRLKLTLKTAPNPAQVPEIELRTNLRAQVSGLKGWIDAELSSSPCLAGNVLTLEVKIPAVAPAAVAPQAKPHGETFGARHPVLRFELVAKGTPADFIGVNVPDYDPNAPNYEAGDRVRFEERLYKATDLLSVPHPAPDPNDDGTGPWRLVPYEHPYQYLETFVVTAVGLEVDVDDLKEVALENDLGPLNPHKPFLPWGPRPTAGSRLVLSAPEALMKPLTELELVLEWKGRPADFSTHYENYVASPDSSPRSDASFTATAGYLGTAGWVNGTEQQIFATGTNSVAFTIVSSSSPLPDRLRSAPPKPARLTSSAAEGFIQVVSTGADFMHAEYPLWLLAYAAPDASDKPAGPPLPPYTPEVKSFNLSYKAKQTVAYASDEAAEKRAHCLFHIGPFGYQEVLIAAPASVSVPGVSRATTIVPLFEHHPKSETPADPVKAEGTLYVGLDGLSAPEQLSLLFQLAEGSENPLLEKTEVDWSYLTSAGWRSFSRTELVSDATDELVASGILELAVPRAATREATALPGPLHWLRATVASRTGAVPAALGVHTQAVVARFVDRDNDPLHLAAPLPAKRIVALARRDAAVKAITQPYASFGGRMRETDAAPEGVSATLARSDAFYVRAAERLRHKQRAVTLFDYERLVLERFPEVYKVRCINHTAVPANQAAIDACNSCVEHTPGSVRVIVVPNLRNQNAVDPLRPRLPLAKLGVIEEYLRARASDFATIRVTNPDFEEVRVTFRVRFRSGVDKGLFTKQLGQDIVDFLCPWRTDDALDLSFGGRVHRSSILQFVEKRGYVDFVSDFRLDQIVDGTTYANVEAAVATRASAVLVSASSHDILDATSTCDDDARDTAAAGPAETGGAQHGGTAPAHARYLGNRNKGELHDLANVDGRCQLGRISPSHRVWFERVQEALTLHYDYCAYCFPKAWSRR